VLGQAFVRFSVHLELFTAWLRSLADTSTVSLAELGQGGQAAKLSSVS
jgi:hypothetical protein